MKGLEAGRAQQKLPGAVPLRQLLSESAQVQLSEVMITCMKDIKELQWLMVQVVLYASQLLDICLGKVNSVEPA
eukprot:1976229-Lingulodinium_polyedra.AAC.1